jgi:hypothetical protein
LPRRTIAGGEERSLSSQHVTFPHQRRHLRTRRRAGSWHSIAGGRLRAPPRSGHGTAGGIGSAPRTLGLVHSLVLVLLALFLVSVAYPALLQLAAAPYR